MVVEGVTQVPISELSHWRHRWARLISLCPDAFVEVDGGGVVKEWNPRAEEVFGWRRDEVVGRSVFDTFLPPDMDASPFDRAAAGEVDRAGGGLAVAGDRSQVELVHRAGHRVVAEGLLFDIGRGSQRSVGGFIQAPGAPDTQTAAGTDRSDTQTILPDRVQFDRWLAGAAARAAGVPGTIAVVLLDLDRFKAINNSMGHDAGDRVLASVAQRLKQAAGSGELVARFGGDEFLALFENRDGEAHTDASAFIERARAALIEPLEIDGTEVFLDASVGVAVNSYGPVDAAKLLSNAEAAMYKAKRRGGSSVETFGESMRIELLDRMTTEHSLHRALERSELLLHYQPVVELHGETTVGVEALIRWQHPEQGLVPPYRFIPVAEESGLIIPIGAWVLEQACHQLRRWNLEGRGCTQGSVEVNLSARQIDDPRIVQTVEGILVRTGVPPEQLTLEITESALMEDAASALGALQALKEIGVLLAIDDFGTGYSSLSYLQRFPLDILKVDRLFVEALGVNAEGEEIVSAVINLAHALGLTVVAEGVETSEQLQILRGLECDLAQGFLFSRPLPAAEIGTAFGLPIGA
jgi:diguanylate cyclase (GGDEF)-like protein/PAS domain S-box-containing protein